MARSNCRQALQWAYSVTSRKGVELSWFTKDSVLETINEAARGARGHIYSHRRVAVPLILGEEVEASPTLAITSAPPGFVYEFAFIDRGL